MLMQKQAYEEMVAKVRKHYGGSVEIGGVNSYDIAQLQKKAAQADVDQARERERQPIVEAGTRLHHTRQRAQKAWRMIADGQAH
jgi:hypothetical protein